MQIPRDGREFAYWGIPAMTPGLTAWQVQLVDAGPWVAVELVTDPALLADAGVVESAAVRLLLYGPSLADTSIGYPFTQPGRPRIRATSSSGEVIIRRGGVLTFDESSG